MTQPPSPRRRDLLTTSALVLSAGGLLAAFWPIVAAMQPDQETRAREKIFSTGRLDETGQAVVTHGGLPILIFRRSPEELEALARTARPDDATSAYRSVRPAIMVVSAQCPQDACVVMRNETYTGAVLRCPCCRSAFNLAGRRLSGSASRDLDVPPYRYLSDFEIEFANPPTPGAGPA